jgi:hypothetical protein
MSYVMQMASQMSYGEAAANGTIPYTTLSLLAMVAHPALNDILYCLYYVAVSYGMAEYVMQTWQVQGSGRTLVGNVTLGVNPNCPLGTCEIEVVPP